MAIGARSRAPGSSAINDCAVTRSGRDLTGWLAENHLSDLHWHARHKLGALAGHAEDVVATILCDIVRGRLPLPTEDADPVAFTIGIVAKRSAHVVRDEARFATLDRDLAAAHPTAWDRANRAVLSRQVDDALRALTAGERDVITMRFWNGLSIEQIAAQRQTAPQTVKELERRGLRKLRAELAAYRSDHDPVAEGS